MIQTLNKQADELSQKVQRLAEKADQFHQSNQKLKDEVSGLKDELKQKNTLLKELEGKLKNHSAVQNIQASTPEQVKELKQKLAEYIREIDRCINKLNAL